MRIRIFALMLFLISQFSGTVALAGSPGVPAAGGYPVPSAGGYYAPSGAPPGWVAPYAGTPYIYQPATPYSYYRSPYNYVSPYNYYGGIPAAPLQPYGGGLYNLSFNGRALRLWRSTSGYYYPWVGGYNYTGGYPIFIVPSGQENPAPTLPPMRVLFSDLNDYLDQAKEKGKISESNYESLKRRANDLLSKEKSLAYEEGGSIDPDQEADIRRDVEELSGEVARHVQP